VLFRQTYSPTYHHFAVQNFSANINPYPAELRRPFIFGAEGGFV
jgi:hypothetical protein